MLARDLHAVAADRRQVRAAAGGEVVEDVLDVTEDVASSPQRECAFAPASIVNRPPLFDVTQRRPCHP